MEKQVYKNILESWQQMVNDAAIHFDNIKSADDVLGLKLSEVKELTEFSRTFTHNMDLLFCDFRHIIGMCDLNAIERTKLMSLFIEITKYRPLAKKLATINTPNVNCLDAEESSYELKTVNSMILTKNRNTSELKITIPETKPKEAEVPSQLFPKLMLTKGKNNEYVIRLDKNHIARDAILAHKDIVAVNTPAPTVTSDRGMKRLLNKLDDGLMWGMNITNDNSNYYVHVPVSSGIWAKCKEYEGES